MDSTLPVMDVVNGIAVPLEFASSIHGLVPNLIASLNVILITLLTNTFTALFTGSEAVTVGATFLWNNINNNIYITFFNQRII